MLEIELKKFLDNYFDTLIEYKHVALRTNSILFNDLKRCTSEDSKMKFASSLILRDWSGETDNGYAFAYPTDSMLYTAKEDYAEFIYDLISKQFCLFYVQSFEGLERLLKDMIFQFASIDEVLKNAIENKLYNNQFFSRNNMPTGDKLLEIIDEYLDSFLYQKGNLEFDLKTAYFVLSKTRHNIVHNNYILTKSKIFCSTNKKELFVDLFMYNEVDNENIRVKLDILYFKNLIDFMCQFSFQIFKKLCLKNNLNWEVYKGMDKRNK
ncbi:hypothetical protein ACYE2N_09440 [Flavobacterium sp. MAHUQ-51]|uniref:hypothetical protein n=1 Tax=Flavobacterium sp. GCM10022190 TaxID=3252639 RepID=UPI00360C8964